MSWTAEEQRRVGKALLGSWPGTMATWGREAIAAFVGELEARGLDPDTALRAIRTWPAGSDFPPSAPNLAAAARRDVAAPTSDEIFQLIFGRRGILRARPPYTGFVTAETIEEARLARAAEMHPLVAGFVRVQGLRRLSLLEVDDPEYGELRRKELAEAWARFVEAHEGREAEEMAALGAGETRSGLRRLDPLEALAPKARSRLELVAPPDDHRAEAS